MHLVMQSKFDDISLLILTSPYLLFSFKEFLFQLLHYHVQSSVSILALQRCLSVSKSTECIAPCQSCAILWFFCGLKVSASLFTEVLDAYARQEWLV